MTRSRIEILLLLGLSAVLGLGLGEALLTWRWADGHSNLVQADGYGSPFLFRGAANSVVEADGVEYRLNNLGMRRETDVSLTPPPDTVRLLVYGDSITNGWRVHVGETYVHLLESGLNRSGRRRWEVLNMYRGGWPTGASFHVRHDVPRLQPQGVLLQIELLNDVSDEALFQTSGRDRDGLPVRISRSRYVLGWDGRLLAPLTVSGSLIERTKVWALVSQNYGQLRSSIEMPQDRSGVRPRFNGSDTYYYNLGFDRFRLDERTLAEGFDRMFDSLAGIHRFLSRHGVRSLIVIVPSRFAYEHPRYRAASLDALRRAEATAAGVGLPFVSLLEALEEGGGADLFMDFCHPNAAGNQVISEAIRPVVASW